jgi:D-hydroxyproline dehydrogenase subunit beta
MAAFDLVVAGAGILGLAHALAATRRGLRVAIVERDARAQRSSVQNFGFITITGQAEGVTRTRALRSREVWSEVTANAGIPVEQQGALIVARRPEALAVLEEFASTESGAGCELLPAAWIRERFAAASPQIVGALFSPHELRVEARDALPAILQWLEQRLGVTVYREREALGIEPGGLATNAGVVAADAVVVCPGSNIAAFAPELAREHDAHDCRLQMLRVKAPSVRLPAVVMGDSSLLRYEGFATTKAAAALRARFESEQPRHVAAGVHVIVAQSSDGTLVVGDSHRYGRWSSGESAEREKDERREDEALILEELAQLVNVPGAEVIDRWTGVYPVATMKPLLSAAPSPRSRVIAITNGLGMSTAFAIGEETLTELFG